METRDWRKVNPTNRDGRPGAPGPPSAEVKSRLGEITFSINTLRCGAPPPESHGRAPREGIHLGPMHRFANPARFQRLSRAIFPWTAGLTVLCLAAGLWFALFDSPPDYQQGETVRIMYIHVPAAWMA